jgi:hypothetical protein
VRELAQKAQYPNSRKEGRGRLLMKQEISDEII